MLERFLEEGIRWLLTSGARMLLILFGAWLLIRVIRAVTTRLIRLVQVDDPLRKGELEKRAETLANILRTVGNTVVVIVALMMALRELGVDITPIVAGAGVVGLAVGFGAQSLIKDVISGFFILLENQFGVGDVIKAGGVAGLVERMNLRVTVLRDIDGAVHFIPNSEIKEVSNLTKEWSRVALDVGVAYREDIDQVIHTLKEIGQGLSRDEVFGPLVLEEPAVLGVERFDDSQVTIRMLVKTLPLKQWDVARELRRRIKKTFDAKGIEIPFPHQATYLRLEESEIAKLEALLKERVR